MLAQLDGGHYGDAYFQALIIWIAINPKRYSATMDLYHPAEIWHACIVLELQYAASLGRPLLKSLDAGSLPVVRYKLRDQLTAVTSRIHPFDLTYLVTYVCSQTSGGAQTRDFMNALSPGDKRYEWDKLVAIVNSKLDEEKVWNEKVPVMEEEE